MKTMIFYVKIEVFKKTWLWIDIIIIIICIQPEGRLWQEPEPSQATGMALAHTLLNCFYFTMKKKIHRCFTSL